MPALCHAQTQRSVLDFVIDFDATEGRPPSISEVADEYGWSRPKAQRSIDATIRAGLLARSDDRSRTLHVTELGWRDRARRESERRGVHVSPATCRICVVAQRHLAKLSPLERQTALAFLAQPLRGLTVPA